MGALDASLLVLSLTEPNSLVDKFEAAIDRLLQPLGPLTKRRRRECAILPWFVSRGHPWAGTPG